MDAKIVDSPLVVVDEHFVASAKAKGGDVAVLKQEGAQDSWGAAKILSEETLFSKQALESIPWLTRDGLRAGTLHHGMLVRYRAMVQDTFDPEYYDCVVRDGDSGSLKTLKYREFDHDVASNRAAAPSAQDIAGLSERLPLYCVPVPGESAWAREARLAAGPARSPPKASNADSMHPAARAHRKRVALQDPARDDTAVEKRPLLGEPETSPQPASSTAAAASAHKLALELDVNNVGDMPCIVKMYDAAMEGIKVSQMIEVVGVLAQCPDSSIGSDAESDETAAVADDFMRLEIAARRPPSSLVPRIHCIAHRSGPTLSLSIDASPKASSSESTTAETTRVREALLSRIATAIGGDRLAAEYVLLWMLSSTVRAGEGASARPVGKLALALAKIPENSTIPKALHNVLANVLPRSHYLELAVADLSSKSLFPKKDYETNRLCAGQLQLCDGTPIIVNETALQEGVLNDQGVRNMQALQQLVQQQKLHYDFQYFACDWDVDTPVLVATSNRTAIVEGADCVLALEQDRAAPTSIASQHGGVAPVSDQDLRKFVADTRLRVAGPNADFTVSQDLATQIEQTYVAARQRDGKSVKAETLDLWLTLAKLWEKSHGRDELTKDGWKAILDMEQARSAANLAKK
ncbi:Mini-chromosome maintenance complex-binding protein [Hondaea fermentalgiana]|uniref:Mini-chromosome maintenance complex-binding protein n=1 Tax=Hondaea fermentalgiana TaxID=2315210 RepID=A0A2R5GEC5_9STRA|nr:Mini-chromosome maintenance complex-binding protein [Hondaea fermentalgiana]|eukprot:GBG28078.1 Mini-chromosome maintenance complex-binding protein [Hondaea fermentalgiana]